MAFIGLLSKLGNKAIKIISKKRRDNSRNYWNKYYANFLSSLPKTSLTDAEKAAVHALFKKRFKYSFVSHTFYKAATGHFDARYIPDPNHVCDFDLYFNDLKLAQLIDNKCFYNMLFPEMPQPGTIVTRQHGFWYDKNGTIISEETAIAAISARDCFCKQATFSAGGKGVYYIKQNESAENIKKIIADIPKDLIVQERIEQSAEIAKLNPSSVNTLRIMTLLRKDGTVKILSVCLRMGISDAKVDNASSGGIVAGVNDDGSLKSVAYSAKGKRFDVHPKTGIHFDTVKIPNYEYIKELICKEVPKHPHFRQIAWDIAIDKNNMPVFIEANLHMGEIDFLQLNNGPLYGDETEAILDEVFGA